MTPPTWVGAIGCMGSGQRYRPELADQKQRFAFMDRMVREYAEAGAHAVYFHNLQGVMPGRKMSAPFLLGCPFHAEFLDWLAKWGEEFPKLGWWFHANHNIPRKTRDASWLSDISFDNVAPTHDSPDAFDFWARQLAPVCKAVGVRDVTVVVDEGGSLSRGAYFGTQLRMGVACICEAPPLVKAGRGSGWLVDWADADKRGQVVIRDGHADDTLASFTVVPAPMVGRAWMSIETPFGFQPEYEAQDMAMYLRLGWNPIIFDPRRIPIVVAACKEFGNG